MTATTRGLTSGGSVEKNVARWRGWFGRIWPVVLVFVVVVAAWEFVVMILQIPRYVLPPPSLIAGALFEELGSPYLWEAVGITMQEVLLGYLLAVSTALLLGVLVGEFRIVERLVLPYAIAFESVPKIALAPLLLIWFGFGIESKVILAALIAGFPMLMNVIEGMRRASPAEVEMMRVFGASRAQIFSRYKFRNALPLIFAALDIGFIFALLGAIVAEFLGASGGLGFRLLTFNTTFNIAAMFAILIILSMIGLLGHFLVIGLRRRVVFWEAIARRDGDS